ncbi:hypothetical protein [Pseudonocardia sp.]|uniref:hypothetical protein n=1 Tax=Pseudonocardia sp. TaxID=60912 RepID=UPI0031FD9652
MTSERLLGASWPAPVGITFVLGTGITWDQLCSSPSAAPGQLMATAGLDPAHR